MFSTKEQVQHLERKVDQLQNDVSQLNTKIDRLEELLRRDVAPSCSKMGDHIEFVECVYKNVKSPLGYLVGKVNYMIGNGPTSPSNNALPDIERVNRPTSGIHAESTSQPADDR